MLSRRAAALLGCLFAAVAAGVSGASAQSHYMADKIVAVVGNSAILYSEVTQLADEIVAQRREEGYTSDRDPVNEALEQLLMRKLLYNQALIDSVKINEGEPMQQAEEYVRRMVEEEGSIAAVEHKYHKAIFNLKEDLRSRIEEMRYADAMRRDIMSKVKITPGEVERFYKSIDEEKLPIVPEQYVYAHITKLPTSTTEAKQRARERLLDMRERIINGARFDMLARMYSADAGSVMRGGEMDPTPLNSLVPEFGEALSKLKPGQISEVVETEFGFHIIQLIDKKGDLYHFRHILIQPTFSDQEMLATMFQLDSVADLVRRDSITFEKAALEFSDDAYSKQNGGLVSNHEILERQYAFDARLTETRFIKDQLMPADYNALSRLKVGEISPSFQTADIMGNVLCKVVKLVRVIPAHPASLKEDYLRLEEEALNEKQIREFNKWLDKRIDGMYVRIEPEFRNGEFENKNWVK